MSRARATQTFEELSARAGSFLGRARVPYSGCPEASVALAADGTWIPGVRVESASFSLMVPALLNAVTAARAAAMPELAALVLAGRPPTANAQAYVEGLPGTWERFSDAGWINLDLETPPVRDMLDPFLARSAFGSRAAPDEHLLEAARGVARRAFVPESDFRVGCLLVLPDGRVIPGVNVEHPDWNSILCAERNALATAATSGCPTPSLVVLTCLRDPLGTPCGACRQLLAEWAPGAEVLMDRGTLPAERRTVAELLPGAFTGSRLGR